MSTVPFAPKTFLALIGDMIAYSRATSPQVTDYNVGSVARTMLEAPALELDALYQMMYVGLIDSIPSAIYEGFNFPRLPAQAARGFVTFTVSGARTEPIVVPANTVVRNPLTPILYYTQSTLTIAQGEGDTTGTVLVAAGSTGAETNAIAGSLTSYLPVISGVTCANADALTGGADEETDEQRRQRFARYIQTLARGTIASLEYAALQGVVYSLGGLPMETVKQVGVEETAGRVNLYIFNGTGSTSDDLVADVEQRVEGYYDTDTGRWVAGYRPAGMRVAVAKMTEVPFDVDVEVDAPINYRGAAFEQDIQDAIGAVISSQRTHPTLRPIEIINGVLGVTGVDGCTILSPTTATTIEPNTVLIPGTLTISWTG